MDPCSLLSLANILLKLCEVLNQVNGENHHYLANIRNLHSLQLYSPKVHTSSLGTILKIFLYYSEAASDFLFSKL